MTRIRYIDCSDQMFDLLAQRPHAAARLDVFRGDPAPDQLAEMLADAEIVLNGHTTMSAAQIAAAPKLREIIFLGSGPASYIDMEAAEGCGVVVRRIAGYGDRAIAEHAFALLLAAARDVTRMDREIRAGVWAPAEGLELAGRRIGVVGLGGIGREMARIAAAFGMEVVAWTRSGERGALPCLMVDLDTLLETSDVVSLHLALTAQTRGLLDRRRLLRMKPGAILVNTARGALVDEAAMIDALKSGRLRHAALDVFATEPLPEGHMLKRMRNVTLTAHAAYKTREAAGRLLDAALALLDEAASASPPFF